jgi:hypothetical protein
MVVHFLDPRAEPGRSVDPYELAVDVTAGPVDVAMLANGFPDSVAFLEELEAALAERLPEARFWRWDKGNASIPAPDSMLDEISARCTVVAAAYGH